MRCHLPPAGRLGSRCPSPWVRHTIHGAEQPVCRVTQPTRPVRDGRKRKVAVGAGRRRGIVLHVLTEITSHDVVTWYWPYKDREIKDVVKTYHHICLILCDVWIRYKMQLLFLLFFPQKVFRGVCSSSLHKQLYVADIYFFVLFTK